MIKKLKDIRHVSFDLDGTLMNSYNTIYKTTLKTLEHLNIKTHLDEPEFYKRIGHHFLDIFNDLNISVGDIEHFINIYKSHYFNFIDDSELYPGVIEVLKHFKNQNIKITLLTTKAQDQTELIIDHFKLREYFDELMGRKIGMAIKPSPEPLWLICDKLSVSPLETLMVGDSDLDIKCGKNAGAFTCAVTYGYRERDILKAEEPDIMINNISELLDYF